MNGANRSIGTGRMVVVLCSLEISFIVCKKAQLQGDRLRRNHRCRLHEFFRGLKLVPQPLTNLRTRCRFDILPSVCC
jgi:hypothetical protein